MAVMERSVTRREPIVVAVDVGRDKPLVFEAQPLPWRKRNDLGDMVLHSYQETLNNLVASNQVSEDGPVTMNVSLFEQGLDYSGMFALAYPGVKTDVIDQLDFNQMVEVLSAALEVNGFDRLVHMLDPEGKKDPMIGESGSQDSATNDAGPKTE